MPRRCSRRRSQVLGLYPCRLCPAGESPSLLRLWNALLVLAGFLGHGGRLALGGRSPRRNPALLAGAAAARPARADRIDGARGCRRRGSRERSIQPSAEAPTLYGRALCGWAGGSSSFRLDSRATEPLALLGRSIGQEGRGYDPPRRGLPQPPCRLIIGSCRGAMPVLPPTGMASLQVGAPATSNTSGARRPPHGRPRNHEILLCRACWPASTSRSIVGRIARSE